MTEDELAEQFQLHRKSLVRVTAWKYRSIEIDDIDMLYTDCWVSLKDSNFKLGSMKSYIEKSLVNRIKNYLRNRMASQDLMDRAYWQQPLVQTDDTAPSEVDSMGNIPDLRPHEAEANEALSARVRRALENVPRTLVVVGEWYYVDELGIQEIAKRLGCSHQNVSILLARFRSLFARQYHHLCSKEA